MAHPRRECCYTRLIGELGRLNQMAVNGRGDTPFHAAARCQNPASMSAMLQTFPTACFVGQGSNDGFEQTVVSELLTICARHGNAQAVGTLIRLGAGSDIRTVLREIIDESVCNPSNSDLLLDVYDTIVEHALFYGISGQKMPKPDSAEYRQLRRRAVLDLLTKPSTKSESVIKHCLNKGANEFLRAIVNTRDVFRSSDGFGRYKAKAGGNQDAQQYVTYDVTDMTPFTMSTETDETNKPVDTR